MLGYWNFQVGKYPNNELSPNKWCPTILPFATFTNTIDKFDRFSMYPDNILQNLGIPFYINDIWVEFIYRASDSLVEWNQSVMVPSIIDARGQWAYKVDKKEEKYNHTRNLRTNQRGVPEIIHGKIESELLEGVIVWTQKCKSSWFEGSVLI